MVLDMDEQDELDELAAGSQDTSCRMRRWMRQQAGNITAQELAERQHQEQAHDPAACVCHDAWDCPAYRAKAQAATEDAARKCTNCGEPLKPHETICHICRTMRNPNLHAGG